MITWQGEKGCEHTHLWMHGTKECFDCWSPRFEREMAARETLPFEAGDDDQTHWDAKIERTRPKRTRKKAG